MKVQTKKRSLVEFNTILIYFCVVVGFVTIRVLNHYNVFAFLGEYAGYFVGIFTQLVLLFLIPLLVWKTRHKFTIKQTFKIFNFKKINLKMLIISIALGLVVFCLNIFISSFFNGFIQLFGYHPNLTGSTTEPTWWMLLLNLLTTAVLPAFCEEFLHRGMLLSGFSKLSMKKNIMITGLLFGLLHLNIEQFFYATIIGVFLGFLVYGCNSIYPSIIVHFMNNATSVILAFARAKGWAFGNIINIFVEYIFKNQILGFIILFLVLCLLLILATSLVVALFSQAFDMNLNLIEKISNQISRQYFFESVERIKQGEMLGTLKVEDEEMMNDIDFKQFAKKNIIRIVCQAGTSGRYNLDANTKIILYGTIILTGIITFMTFIWGILF